MNRREYIISNFIKEDYICESTERNICLEETDPGGESQLQFHVSGKNVLILKNIDKKNFLFGFFRDNKELSLNKRVDHIIFEEMEDNTWKVHLIEMKSSVKEKKWIEVKGKFRSSYFLVAALAESTAPASHRTGTGRRVIPYNKEWTGEDFGIQLETRTRFSHIPILMTRKADDKLYGTYTERA